MKPGVKRAEPFCRVEGETPPNDVLLATHCIGLLSVTLTLRQGGFAEKQKHNFIKTAMAEIKESSKIGSFFSAQNQRGGKIYDGKTSNKTQWQERKNGSF